MTHKYFLLFIFLLNSCGLKGDLYLPKEGENIKYKFAPVQTGIKINFNKKQEKNIQNTHKTNVYQDK